MDNYLHTGRTSAFVTLYARDVCAID